MTHQATLADDDGSRPKRFRSIHLAPEPLGFGRHAPVRRHWRASTLIRRIRGHGPFLQHRWIRHPLWEWAELL